MIYNTSILNFNSNNSINESSSYIQNNSSKIDLNNYNYKEYEICINLTDSNIDCINIVDSCYNNDSCYFDKSVSYLNSLYCYNIKDFNLSSQCFNEVKTSSIIIGAVTKDDISLCELFDENQSITACKNNYYFVNSVNKNDKSLCNNVTVEEFKNECFER